MVIWTDRQITKGKQIICNNSWIKCGKFMYLTKISFKKVAQLIKRQCTSILDLFKLILFGIKIPSKFKIMENITKFKIIFYLNFYPLKKALNRNFSVFLKNLHFPVFSDITRIRLHLFFKIFDFRENSSPRFSGSLVTNSTSILV